MGRKAQGRVSSRRGHQLSVNGASGASSMASTPYADKDLSSGSELGTSPVSSPSRDLTDHLFNYVSQIQGQDSIEPPTKRQKTSRVSYTAKDQYNDLEHIVVKKTTWEIKLTGSRLAKTQAPITRTDCRVYVSWTSDEVEYLEVVDGSKSAVFHIPLPQREELENVHLALMVHRDSKKWAKGQGRLWTQFDITLGHRNEHDVLDLIFTIKWNTTLSPYHLSYTNAQTPALRNVLAKYFPDSSVTRGEKWTPQDFYQSVHTPDRVQEDAAAIVIDDLKADLYPFQKRAVQWLLRREGVEWFAGQLKCFTKSDLPRLPISFLQVRDELGQQCYVSHLYGLVTSDIKPFTDLEDQLRGGILAEEMGLGKTVEMISLISLHRRPSNLPDYVFDIFTGQHVRPAKGTLIIAPPSILRQWISEINRHAPNLKCLHYEGMKAQGTRDADSILNKLLDADVVITTYGVLSAEIHFTQLNPEKSLRNESKYKRPKSPLMQLSWWRCLIDEAQQIESGVSKAAIVARMIPRVNAWCVTGTPVRKDVHDLLGLLVFLRYEPFASIKHVWSSLISSHKSDFRSLFQNLALRHSKQSVRDELKLPAQRRYVITMPFTPIEEQNYQELFKQMCEDCGLDSQGAPLTQDWDPEPVSDTMRRWLVRLRQTALHPEVGGRNKRALGQKDGPLRTVDEVLNVMMEQTESTIRVDERALLLSNLRRGQLFENSPRVKEALTIWEAALTQASDHVGDAREQLRQELIKVSAMEKSRNAKDSSHQSDSDSEDDQGVDPTSELSVLRLRLRGWLEVLHMATFFRANAMYQIKTNEDMTQVDSDEFKALENLEADQYDKAKRLRREILREIYHQANKIMKKISSNASTQSFVQIPEIVLDPSTQGGIESRRIMDQLDELAVALSAQAEVVDTWREEAVRYLLLPLVDEDEGLELTGDEYEDSTKIQEEVEVYLQALRAAFADRHDSLTGQQNNLVEFEVKAALDLATGKKDVDGTHTHGPAPEKMIALLGQRHKIKPPRALGSVRGVIAELRALATALRPAAENGNARSQNELAIVEKQLKDTQKQLSTHLKANLALEKELETFTTAMNARLQYYKQLQQVSDMVAPYEGPTDDSVHARLAGDEAKLTQKLAVARSKRTYLQHLKDEASIPQEQRICVICRESFEIGALTVCGHQYCKECIRLWWNAHHNCPICKRKLGLSDLHEITYKPQQLSVETEDIHDPSRQTSPSKTGASKIYSDFSKAKLNAIQQTELDGPSFGTKVDTLARQILWLRETDPGAKSIIFSQFKGFLETLAQAFSRFRIGFTSIDRAGGIEQFRRDPGIECFLLHARAHSSGLNLVNANHVFLCEPLLNTALELQAIARVDRIGQHQETNVWLYLVDGTVEESIYRLSSKRRMEHLGQRLSSKKGKEKEFSRDEALDTEIEAANSLELQQASLTNLLEKGNAGRGGEMIAKEDLWECLFGGVAQKTVDRALHNSSLRLDEEVGRHLRGEAAENRIVI